MLPVLNRRRGKYHILICVFFFNDAATTEIYTLSLHDALPIFGALHHPAVQLAVGEHVIDHVAEDRKSTRLNSSHVAISYAVFCLKKKNILNACIVVVKVIKGAVALWLVGVLL